MSHNHGVSFFAGLLIGGAIGATSMLLLAPQSGEETRTEIRDKGIELKEKAETTYAHAQEKLQTTVADLKTRLAKETQRPSKESESEGYDVPDR